MTVNVWFFSQHIGYYISLSVLLAILVYATVITDVQWTTNRLFLVPGQLGGSQTLRPQHVGDDLGIEARLTPYSSATGSRRSSR
jgi:hypothetical protein